MVKKHIGESSALNSDEAETQARQVRLPIRGQYAQEASARHIAHITQLLIDRGILKPELPALGEIEEA